MLFLCGFVLSFPVVGCIRRSFSVSSDDGRMKVKFRVV